MDVGTQNCEFFLQFSIRMLYLYGMMTALYTVTAV